MIEKLPESEGSALGVKITGKVSLEIEGNSMLSNKAIIRVFAVLLISFVAGCASSPEKISASHVMTIEKEREATSDYEATVSQWNSYEDVANWMKANYSFDRYRQKQILRHRRQHGPAGLWSVAGMLQSPTETFRLKKGHCKDAANFAIDALNRINPEYNARFVFVWNKIGPPHHWVTGFTMNGKLYIMDFGAGPRWQAMNGVHGPYSTLSEYVEFLSSLHIKRFVPESAEWRH